MHHISELVFVMCLKTQSLKEARYCVCHLKTTLKILLFTRRSVGFELLGAVRTEEEEGGLAVQSCPRDFEQGFQQITSYKLEKCWNPY